MNFGPTRKTRAGEEAASADARGPRRYDEEPDGETAIATEGEDSGFTVRRRQINTEEIDLTPMVDMTFLLLIFFMITASFQLQKDLEVPSPSPEQSGASQALMPADELEQTTISGFDQ